MFNSSINGHLQKNTHYHLVNDTFDLSKVCINNRTEIVSNLGQAAIAPENSEYSDWNTDNVEYKGILIIPSTLDGDHSRLAHLKQVSYSREKSVSERVGYIANSAMASIALDGQRIAPTSLASIWGSIKDCWSSEECVVEKRLVNYLSPISNEKEFIDVIRFLPKNLLSEGDILALRTIEKNQKSEKKLITKLIKSIFQRVPKLFLSSVTKKLALTPLG